MSLADPRCLNCRRLLGRDALVNRAARLAVAAVIGSRLRGRGSRLGLHHGVPAVDFLEAHHHKPGGDKNPVEVVRDDRAIRGRVGPAQDSSEDVPSTVVDNVGRAALSMSVMAKGNIHVYSR